MGSSEFHVFRIKPGYSTEFVFDYLNRAEIRNEAQKNMTGASGHRRVPIAFYEELIIVLSIVLTCTLIKDKSNLL